MFFAVFHPLQTKHRFPPANLKPDILTYQTLHLTLSQVAPQHLFQHVEHPHHLQMHKRLRHIQTRLGIPLPHPIQPSPDHHSRTLRILSPITRHARPLRPEQQYHQQITLPPHQLHILKRALPQILLIQQLHDILPHLTMMTLHHIVQLPHHRSHNLTKYLILTLEVTIYVAHTHAGSFRYIPH